MRSIVLALLLTVCTLWAFAEDKVFNADFRHRPPQLVVGENSNFSGPLKDVLEEAAARIGFTVKWRDAPFKRSLEDVKNGKVDIVPRYRKNKEREVFTNYLGPIGYQLRETRFVALTGREDIIQSYDDLQKYSVGIKRGTSYYKQFNDDKQLNKKEVVDDAQIVKMLQGKRFDVAVIIDEGAFLDAAKKAGFTSWSYTPFKHVQKLPNYYGMSKTSPNASAYNELNSALQDMAKSGRVAEAYQKFDVEPPVQ